MTNAVAGRVVISEEPVASPSQSRSGEPSYYSTENMVRRTYSDGGVVIACTKPLADGSRCQFEAERSGQIRSHVRYVAHQQDLKATVNKSRSPKKAAARRHLEKAPTEHAAVATNTAEGKPRAARHGRKPAGTAANGFADVPVSELLNIAQQMGEAQAELAQLRASNASYAAQVVALQNENRDLARQCKEQGKRNTRLTAALTRAQSTLNAAAAIGL